MMNEPETADHLRTTSSKSLTLDEFIRAPIYRRNLHRRYAEYPPDEDLPPPADVVRTKRGAQPSLVYFIQADGGEIKIGRATDVMHRLRTLQTAHAHPLKLLVVSPGGKTVEERYHARFREHRLNGEWFKPHDAILAEIARLQETTDE